MLYSFRVVSKIRKKVAIGGLLIFKHYSIIFALFLYKNLIIMIQWIFILFNPFHENLELLGYIHRYGIN